MIEMRVKPSKVFLHSSYVLGETIKTTTLQNAKEAKCI